MIKNIEKKIDKINKTLELLDLKVVSKIDNTKFFIYVEDLSNKKIVRKYSLKEAFEFLDKLEELIDFIKG
jgi:uncharacterized FlaG/YvyC family protein